MFCTKCGAPLTEGAKFCVKCGTKQAQEMRPKGEVRQKQPERRNTAGNSAGKPRTNTAQGIRPNVGRPNPERTAAPAPAPKKNPLLPILIIVAILAVAAVAVTVLYATGKIDLGFGRSEKAKTEKTAEISDEDEEKTSSKKKKSEKTEEAAAASSEDEKEEETAAAASETSSVTEEKEDGDVKAKEKPAAAAEATPEATPEAVEIPKDYASLIKVLKDRSGAELNLVSSDVSDYPNVKLYYSYNDPDGEPISITDPVTGIKETIAGGAEIERKIRSVQQLEGNQGLSIDIIADKSGSMKSDLYTMQNIMSEFVSNMDFTVGDAAELIAFDSYIMYMCTYTQDPSLLQNGISNMTASGDTALYDAIMAGITNASYQQGARCVIAFTDGEDNRSQYTPEEIIRQSVDKEVPVYIIGLGSAASSTLTRICDETGGKYWNIGSINDMSEVMDEIYSSQKSMYCIEYESDPNADPYAERSVSCIISDKDLSGTESSDTFTATEALKEQHHESRYELVKADVSWTEANDLCIAKGGHLATITTAEEQKQLSEMAEKAGLKYIWIGGYTSVRDNNAYGHWVTGEPFEYTAWYPGEPSRTDSLDNVPEFYIMLWNVEGEWSWNDQRNVLAGDPELTWFAGNMGYIIEYEN